MAGRRPDYRLGRIIWARLLGRNGKREEHPAVIISPDAEIIQPEYFDPRLGGGEVVDNLVAVLGISTKYAKFNDPYICIPHDSRTQLTADCAVISNWFGVIAIPDDCEFLLGDVPANLMVQINDEYRKFLTGAFTHLQGTLAYCLNLLGPQR